MICRNCIRAATRSRMPSMHAASQRFVSSTAPLKDATPVSVNTATQTASRQGAPTSSHTPPAATSTSAAQPFSEPLTPSADCLAPPRDGAKLIVKSSVAAGTPLKGLNFLKNKSDPVAMEDHEYPDWLWEILAKQEKKGETAAEGDLFSKSKKQRRLAAKRLRKQQEANPELLAPKVPLHEQTVDMPAGDGTLEGAIGAGNARRELTKALRAKRRASIKEANFLKAMG